MEEDIISQLPDEILQHILSFIDTTQAIKTSILSKRWKHLWRSLLNIRLHLHGDVSYYRFVYHFLSHRDATAPVHSLHFSIDDKSHLTLVEEYVLYAINHGVQSLRLHAPIDLILTLPAALFTSTTLRELEIRRKYTTLDVLQRFSLPNLKTFYLGTHLFFNDDHGREPFAGLMELEKLSLRGFPMAGIVLKAPKMRVLEIFESDQIQEISAPLLISFRYEGYLPLECSRMNLPILEKIYLDIHGLTSNPEWLHLNCVRLLHQLGNATTVSLTLDTLKLLEPPQRDLLERFPTSKCFKVIKGGQVKINTGKFEF